MNRIKSWYRKTFWPMWYLNSQLKEIKLNQRIIKSQLDYLMKNTNRRIRRKWTRLLKKEGIGNG